MTRDTPVDVFASLPAAKSWVRRIANALGGYPRKGRGRAAAEYVPGAPGWTLQPVPIFESADGTQWVVPRVGPAAEAVRGGLVSPATPVAQRPNPAKFPGLDLRPRLMSRAELRKAMAGEVAGGAR